TARGVADAIDEYDELLRGDVSRDPLAVQSPPHELSSAEVESWHRQLIVAVERSVRPALARLRDFFQLELLPVASSDERAGVCHLPNGAEAYEDLLHAATSTSLGSADIHQLGLDQLGRLDDEYRQIGGQSLGTDEPALVRDRLRSDAGLRYTSTEEIISDID